MSGWRDEPDGSGAGRPDFLLGEVDGIPTEQAVDALLEDFDARGEDVTDEELGLPPGGRAAMHEVELPKELSDAVDAAVERMREEQEVADRLVLRAVGVSVAPLNEEIERLRTRLVEEQAEVVLQRNVVASLESTVRNLTAEVEHLRREDVIGALRERAEGAEAMVRYEQDMRAEAALEIQRIIAMVEQVKADNDRLAAQVLQTAAEAGEGS